MNQFKLSQEKEDQYYLAVTDKYICM